MHELLDHPLEGRRLTESRKRLERGLEQELRNDVLRLEDLRLEPLEDVLRSCLTADTPERLDGSDA